MGSDLWDTVTNPIGSVVDALEGVQELIDDPIGTAQEVWEDFTEPYVEDWENGREGEAIGRGLVELGANFIPGYNVLKWLNRFDDANSDDGFEAPPSESGSSGGNELPEGDPPSSDSDGPIDDPPGGDPPAAGSDESDDNDSDSGKDDEDDGDNSELDNNDGAGGGDAVLRGSGFTVNESKFDYFFGRVTSSPHNTERSLQNLEDLKKLGIDEAAGGRERLVRIFQEGTSAPEVNSRHISEYGVTITRRVEVSGGESAGAIDVKYFYPRGDLSATPEVSTIIPKIYR